MKDLNFTVYSKDGCPYCTKVAKVLELCELKHIIYKLNVDYNKTEFYEKFGQGATFPKVICNDEFIGGCTETIAFLKENNMV